MSKTVHGWQEVAIQECGEKLVSLSGLSSRIVVRPRYIEQGIEGALRDVYVREAVADRLVLATEFLPKNHKFVVWDGWRPLSIQEALFDMFKVRVQTDNPSLSEEEVIRLTTRFVSLPSSRPDRPSPHYTGGSIDLSVLSPKGAVLDMGTEFNEFTDKAKTDYYDTMPDLFQEDRLRRENRLMLLDAMENAAFTNYPEEWWHFDYGNQFFARIDDYGHAKYGGVEGVGLV